MRALVFGAEPEQWTPPPGANQLVQNLAVTPVRLTEIEDARPLRPDWAVVRPLLTGICGSDSKQILMDFGLDEIDNAMGGAVSRSHRCSATSSSARSVALGPEAEGVEVGDRVVLNPWLSLRPPGHRPRLPGVRRRRPEHVPQLHRRLIATGSTAARRRTRPVATPISCPPTRRCSSPFPTAWTTRWPCSPTLRGVAAQHHPASAARRRQGRRLRRRSLGSCAVAILRELYPDVEIAVVARFDAQAALARSLGASMVLPSDDRLRAHRGDRRVVRRPAHPAVGRPADGAPRWRRRRLRHGRQAGDVRSRRPGPPGEGHAREVRRHGAARWEWSPLYFKELTWVGSNAFGIEEVEGHRQHGIAHYLDLAAAGRVDLRAMLTHTFRLEEWREAFRTIADQGETGAIKVAFDFR